MKLHDTWAHLFKCHQNGMLALCVGFLGGVLGVSVDIDHLLLLFGFKGVGLEGRPLHTTMLVISSLLFIGGCACLGRCVHRLVLKSKEIQNIEVD
jgi:hypothetical protein